MHKKTSDFFFQIFEKHKIPEVYQGVELKLLNKIDNNVAYSDHSNAIHSVLFVPDYLNPILDRDVYKVKSVEQFFKGYTIDLRSFKTADAYIKDKFRSNAKGIRRKIRRLETCFSISYKYYYGKIELDEYNRLLDLLYEMIVNRFEQRNEKSHNLPRWEYYKEIYFDLINKKEALLFVVYDEEKPIMISLNNLYNHHLFSSVSSFDTDYAKFSLGSLEIYKKLEWCISNNVISYEMGMGDLTYKKDWSNYIYPFRHHIVFPKEASYIDTIKANLEYVKVSIKEYLFKTFYQKYKNYKESKKSDPEPKVNYKIIEVVTNELPKNKKEINFRENDSYTVLKRLVFDFLYTTSVHKSVVKTFYFPDVNTVLITDEKDNHQVVQFDGDYDLSGKLLFTS